MTQHDAHSAGQEQFQYFPALVEAIKRVHGEGPDVSTKSFAELMDILVKVFDHMGAVLHIAKSEMMTKTASLHNVASERPTLREVVEADKAAGAVTTKDSPARNLHRLVYVIKFVRVLLEQFSSSKVITTREAANKAYEQSLGQLHVYLVRSAVWAGFYMLPARDEFMKQLGETEDSATVWAQQFLEFSEEVELRVMTLFQGVSMPIAAASSNILSSLWAKTPTPAAAT